MNTARQIINEIIQEGAKFTLHGGEVGLTQIVNDDLLARAMSLILFKVVIFLLVITTSL